MTDPQAELLAYQPPADALADRVILITGATGGIGQALSEGFAAHGAQTVLSGRSIKPLNQLCDRIEQAGHLAPLAVPLNLERAGVDDYEVLATALRDRFGRLDGIVLNAAMLGELTRIDHFDPMLWARVMQVNLHSNFLLLRSILPLLAASADAAVVVSGDRLAQRARAYWGAYAVSKRALEGLAEVLAEELSAARIRVNSIDPGPTRTQLRAQAYPAELPQTSGTPASLIPAYVYLLSAASRGYTGCKLHARDTVHR